MPMPSPRAYSLKVGRAIQYSEHVVPLELNDSSQGDSGYYTNHQPGSDGHTRQITINPHLGIPSWPGEMDTSGKPMARQSQDNEMAIKNGRLGARWECQISFIMNTVFALGHPGA